jgi:phosphonate transport system substrate-binding protein
VTQTAPYDHCNMTVDDSSPGAAGFTALLLSMSYEDAAVRPLLDLEGLRRWTEGRTSGYAQLAAAVDAVGFYDRQGRVTAAEYQP